VTFRGSCILDPDFLARTNPRPREVMAPFGESESSLDRVVARMRAWKIPGLPRNYELIYEMEMNPTRELRVALSSVCGEGRNPSQNELDEIYDRFVRHVRGDAEGISAAHRKVLSDIDEVMRLMQKEQRNRREYGEVLGTASKGIHEKTDGAILVQVAQMLAAATEQALSNGVETEARMSAKSRELESLRNELERFRNMAYEDPLTGVANRRAFNRDLGEVFGKEMNGDVALILLDIDHFKSFNDRFGHPMGDQVLKLVAKVICENVHRHKALVARTGGEEFAIIVRDITRSEAVSLAERVRVAIGASSIVNRSSGENYGSVTMSSGICMAADSDGPDDLYRKADEALYESKRCGRNLVTAHIHQAA